MAYISSVPMASLCGLTPEITLGGGWGVVGQQCIESMLEMLHSPLESSLYRGHQRPNHILEVVVVVLCSVYV